MAGRPAAGLQQNALYGAPEPPGAERRPARRPEAELEAPYALAGAQQRPQQRPRAHQSLYSPSSSTSLLYHIYDQIQLPGDQPHYQPQFQPQFQPQQPQPQQHYQHQHQNQLYLGAGANQPLAAKRPATVLNPAHLFDQQAAAYAPPLFAAAFQTLQPHQAHQAHQAAYQAHQHTLAARNQRPLSSSGNSSLSGGSAIAYGRHARAPAGAPLSAGAPAAAAKTGASSLAGVLHAGLGHQAAAGGHPARLGRKHASGAQRALARLGPAWARLQRALRRRAQLLHWALVLFLFALGALTLLKLALPSSRQQQQQQQQQQLQQQQLQQLQFQQQLATLTGPSPLLQASNSPPGPFKPPPLKPQPPPPHLDEAPAEGSPPEAGAKQDVLKSKLLIGEFAVTSQNYSHSASFRQLLTERLVKLLDQVFLSTDVRRVYARTEITNIRPHKPAGVLVECSILLSDSIAYAAQQFGIALYDSLARTNERLASQQSYVIDKSSIRFNTVPDKDLKSGLVPAGLLPASVSRELAGEPPEAPAPPGAEQVVWSEWSQWSSCADKDGLCDPGRVHSRLRRCVSQHTGDKVEASQCKARFGAHDQDIELADCARSCANEAAAAQAHVQSDAPSVLAGPHTAPPVLLAAPAELAYTAAAPAELVGLAAEPPQPAPASAAASTAAPASSAAPPAPAEGQPEPLPAQPAAGEPTSCANCTAGEVCLLLVQQKVPFCAKVRDQLDESGCGGWCKSHGQLCQPLGLSAFKCVHDSECLAEEWRCHDSACIPLSKRCDGHANCYDSSDERDCPPRPPQADPGPHQQQPPAAR